MPNAAAYLIIHAYKRTMTTSYNIIRNLNYFAVFVTFFVCTRFYCNYDTHKYANHPTVTVVSIQVLVLP